MHHLKKFVLYTIMALCAFSLLLFVIPTDKMSPGSRNTPKDLKSYMKFHHINGVMLVSGKDGTPVVVENNETTNKEKIVKANQLFPTASLQKIMTGTGIYQLQQKKQLNWNTPLSKYFPQVPGSNEITIRELMNHTSGLINNARPNEPLKTQQEQIAYMLDHMQYDHLHTWDYQDVDYELLAAIISRESNLTYNNYIQNQFAKPLHLNQIKDFSEVNKKEIPQPLNENVSWHTVTVTTSSDFGAGNLFISPNDYWKFVYSEVLKDPKMINQFSQQTKGQEVAYFGGVYFKGNIIRAEGSIPGYNSCFVADYKTKQMIMLFSNNIDYLTLKRTSDYILHHYYGEL
ncbi:MAG: beta-lactamase family protein [Lactobacillus sp.]|uniref:serine hydrolase domain-containing protein n=1 Tax=Lactobacillus johnsonii TaxID=33959 RepID=UPI0019C88672|nr:serine hydrolase domain-containing protein [Lactobacillus johnsonii]MBC9722594.1 beta-lactamase family protein [Lactobacillus sp.]MCL5443599.1 beta-lactamase family protein [Lactobacillus johnsonii]